MIHRFVDLLERVLVLDIPILVLQTGATTARSIWKIGNGLTPVRMDQTAISSLGTPQTHLGDPHREPSTGDYVVYSRFTATGTITRSVRLVDWADTTDIELYSDGTGGAGESLQPMFSPDGTQILFRAKGSGAFLTLIKTMDADGSNVQTIYTGSSTVFTPTYSWDGTKIVFTEGQDVHVMNADGSSHSVIYSGTSIHVGAAWSKDDSLLAVKDTFGGNENWRTMTPAGGSVSTWLAISRTGYGPGQSNPGPIIWTWTNNDEIATTVRVPADPDPDARLTLIDSGGNNFISPAQYAASDTGFFDVRPLALTGRSEEVERIWWLENLTGDQVVSVLPDGSDYRVDFNVANAAFHGFRDSTNSP